MHARFQYSDRQGKKETDAAQYLLLDHIYNIFLNYVSEFIAVSFQKMVHILPHKNIHFIGY